MVHGFACSPVGSANRLVSIAIRSDSFRGLAAVLGQPSRAALIYR